MSDLFTWTEEMEAAQVAREAKAARERALARAALSPPGQVGVRRQRAMEATTRELEAVLVLKRVMAERARH